MLPDIVRILIPAAATFAAGIACAPVLTHYLYKHRAWKKRPGKQTLGGDVAHEFNRLHTENEVRAPRMGGILVWGSVLLTTFLLALLAALSSSAFLEQLNYLSRNQTWLPLATLLAGALVGLIDDIMVIGPSGEGLRLRYRLIVAIVLSSFIGWWFWAKLAVVAVNIPFAAPITLGWLIIPFFVFVSLCVYASGVIDGIDGLSGGVFASIFASYTVIAAAQSQVDLAAFCAATLGGLLAFLWFNVPPARFYMSDTGTMALTLSLAVVVFMTDSLGGGYGVAVLPLIGALLVITVLSNVLQISWKLIFHTKLFRIAPLHHHFEAIGWSSYKVVMRYWILSLIFSFAGVVIALAAL